MNASGAASSSSAPLTRVAPPAPDPELKRFSRMAGVSAFLALAPVFAVITVVLGDDDAFAFAMGTASAGAFVGFFWAIATIVRLGRTPREIRPYGMWLAILSLPVALVSSFFGAVAAIFAGGNFTRGRQLRERGRPVFAPLHVDASNDEGWLDGPSSMTERPLALGDDDVERAAIADGWRANGKTEHASVGAFAKLAADLVALGAPARLVADAHADALDEIRHAQLCFSLARAIDGRDLVPGALPAASTSTFASSLLAKSRSAALAHLAVESLLEGALNEGTSARAVAKLARRVEDAAVRDVLLAIARDEGRHASHGWHVLAWALKEGGLPAREAVRGALRALPRVTGKALVVDADDARWEHAGIPGRALIEESYAEVRASVLARATALVDGMEATLARAA